MSGYRRLTLLLLRVISIVALVVTVAGTVVLSPWQAVERREADATERSVPWTAVNPVGVNTFLASEVESWKREKTMEMISAAGIGWIKQHFAWSEIEPQDDVYWDVKYNQDAWKKFDEIVDLAERHGVRIIARLDQTPEWARPLGTDPTTPPTDPTNFGDFVEAFVSHYKGRIQFLQIWNEPNLAAEWGGRIDPEGYARLLAEAARRAREVDPNVVIISAPLAMTTENSDRAWDELRYWQALYDHGAADSFDIIAANAYGLDRRFDDPARPDVLNLRRVELLRSLADKNGDSGKAIWLNEFGWNTAPEEFPADELTWSRVSEDVQAQWTADGIEFARAAWPSLGVTNIWYFRQVGDVSPARADYYFRMVDVEFTPRDVYLAVREDALPRLIAQPGEYGDLEAPVRQIGAWSIIRDTRASDGEFVQAPAGAQLIVRFNGSSLDLRLGPGESSGQLRVALAEGEEPPAFDASASVVNIDAARGVIRVAGSGDGSASPRSQRVQTALVEVTPGSSLALDGISVGYERSYGWLAGGLAALIAALAARAAYFAIERRQ